MGWDTYEETTGDMVNPPWWRFVWDWCYVVFWSVFLPLFIIWLIGLML